MANIECFSPNRVILNNDLMPVPINEFFHFKKGLNSHSATSEETTTSFNNFTFPKSPNISCYSRTSENLPRVNISNKKVSSASNSSTSLYSYFSETLASLSTMCKHIEFDKFGRTVEKFSCEEIYSKYNINFR